MLFLACGSENRNSSTTEDGECTPTYLRAPSNNDVCSVWVGGLFEFSFRFAIVGCSDDLASVGDSETIAIQQTMEKLVGEVNFRILGLHSDPSLRQRFSAKINETIGRDIVTDVLVFDIHTGEGNIP